MPKHLGPASLNLSSMRTTGDGEQPMSPSLSLHSPGSPFKSKSNPGSPRLEVQAKFAFQQAPSGSQSITVPKSQMPQGSTSPQMGASPADPPSPSRASPKHGRDASKSFFSNLMASKSSHRLHSPDSSIAEPAERSTIKSRATSKDRSLHPLRPKGSTPELPKTVQANSVTSDHIPSGEPARLNETQPSHDPSRGQQIANSKGRSKLGGILNRTKSIKLDDTPKYKARSPSQLNLDPSLMQKAMEEGQYSEPIRTAPIPSDHRERAFADDAGSVMRNRSADRHLAPRQDDNARKDRFGGSIALSHSFRDGAGLLSNLHQTGRGVGDRLGRAGKGFLGKITRSGSTNERELVNDDNYTCTVINMPLVKQTRKTRIARRLEISKDKTEFWMPALPWRCIDYLNMNGCEEEGLYRIPGSGREVKHWQRRFDTEFDINLFDEPELYDINTIGSMFKAWLRDLPDEILPKPVQAKISKECAGATKTPKLLKDELSKLPPFNYYLLFAITCHLSLLHSFADKNKMDYRNLCICFQPCLKIDGFVFQFLVQDWKSCWQGCWTEKQYLEEEYRYEREGSINGSDDHSADERAVSSSGSSQHVPVPDVRPSSQRKASLPRSVRKKPSSSGGVQMNGIGHTHGNSNSNSNSTNSASATGIPAVPRIEPRVEPRAEPRAEPKVEPKVEPGAEPRVEIRDETKAEPRAVKTPEPQIISAGQLPELQHLSPIKF